MKEGSWQGLQQCWMGSWLVVVVLSWRWDCAALLFNTRADPYPLGPALSGMASSSLTHTHFFSSSSKTIKSSMCL